MTTHNLTVSEARDAAWTVREHARHLRKLIEEVRRLGLPGMIPAYETAAKSYAALADKLEAIAQEHGRE